MQDLRFLKAIAKFTHENYDLWQDMPIDDIALWFLRSYKEGTLLPVMIGVGERAEMIMLSEYWTVTPNYIRKLRQASGKDLPLPGEGEREGELIFFPVTIINKKYVGKVTFRKMLEEKFRSDYPEITGVYRWVLKDQRCRFMPFKRRV